MINIVGDIFTGKTTVASKLADKIPDSQLIDKSKILTYPPIMMGYNENGALDDVSLDEFIEDIKNYPGKVDKSYIDSLSRGETIEFSYKLNQRFSGEDPSYNLTILSEFIDEEKVPIIAGARYFESFKKLSEQGYMTFGLKLDDKDEIRRRSEEMHNHTWEDPFYQKALEDKFFDIDKIMKSLPEENKFDTAKYGPDKITDMIYERWQQSKNYKVR
ncbi:MAG: hypothetical protein ACQEP1_00755 [Nanobdellota archaeon]